MSVNPNVNEADDFSDDDNNQPGWFYHAPARRRTNEPVLYPPMSQVPGLAEDYSPPEEPPRPLFKDTDTKYIRLAKQGGRANLLQMRENSSDKRQPVFYPRNDWFYLEDNAMEDAAEKKKNEIEYDFLRPEYMVHDTHKRDNKSTHFDRPARGPIAFDKLSVFEREPGQCATDKTVKLPEVKKHGYGVRSGKPLRLPKNKPSSAQTDPGKGPHPLKYLPIDKKESKKTKPTTETGDKPKISKILGYAYEREWQDQLKEWQDKQDIGRNRHRQMTNIPSNMDDLKIQSEYTVNFGKPSAVIHSDLTRPQGTQQSSRPSEGKQGYSVRQNEAQRLREAKLQKPVEKDPFIMSRFKNVPARIETHRHVQPQTVAPPQTVA